MPVKDTFDYAARYESVGLDCAFCQHFRGPEKWPDISRISRCELHHVSLAVELREEGYKLWEWFCRDFTDTGRAFTPSVAHFLEIREQLEPEVLYRFYGTDGFLVEHKIAGLDKR
jgi:hypothetical protein